MIQIKIDSRKVEDVLKRLQRSTNNLTPALDEIGQHLVSEIDLNFRDAKDPYGKPWDELKHREGKPLNDTGRLKNSITYNSDNDAVEIGTNVEYARFHPVHKVRSFIPVPLQTLDSKSRKRRFAAHLYFFLHYSH